MTDSKVCIAEGHWTTIFDTETGMGHTVHDPDEGPCEYGEVASD